MVNTRRCLLLPFVLALPPKTKYEPDPIADGILDGASPEALIYEPVGNGWLRLVGVEFIQLADDWTTRHP